MALPHCPSAGLQCEIVVLPDHTHLLFLNLGHGGPSERHALAVSQSMIVLRQGRH